ncbi:hypothetical protein [Fimbriiglobus ruber]|nr:hypothetical protein [Fimbriiglobus ruber]
MSDTLAEVAAVDSRTDIDRERQEKVAEPHRIHARLNDPETPLQEQLEMTWSLLAKHLSWNQVGAEACRKVLSWIYLKRLGKLLVNAGLDKKVQLIASPDLGARGPAIRLLQRVVHITKNHPEEYEVDATLRIMFDEIMTNDPTNQLARCAQRRLAHALRGEILEEGKPTSIETPASSKVASEPTLQKQALPEFQKIQDRSGSTPRSRTEVQNPKIEIDGSGEQPKKIRKGTPMHQAEILVAEYLSKHKQNEAEITRDEVADATGVSTGSVSNTRIWKAFQKFRKDRSKPKLKTRQMGDRITAVLSDDLELDDLAPEVAELYADQQQDKAKDDSFPERHQSRRHAPS